MVVEVEDVFIATVVGAHVTVLRHIDVVLIFSVVVCCVVAATEVAAQFSSLSLYLVFSDKNNPIRMSTAPIAHIVSFLKRLSFIRLLSCRSNQTRRLFPP